MSKRGHREKILEILMAHLESYIHPLKAQVEIPNGLRRLALGDEVVNKLDQHYKEVARVDVEKILNAIAGSEARLSDPVYRDFLKRAITEAKDLIKFE